MALERRTAPDVNTRASVSASTKRTLAKILGEGTGIHVGRSPLCPSQEAAIDGDPLRSKVLLPPKDRTDHPG
jgi:hypothetical protein